MTLDVKLPRWLACLVFAIWTLSIIEGMVAQGISAWANLHYLERPAIEPPPPYPGQPVQRNEPAMPRPTQPAPKPKDEDERRRPFRPRK